MHYYFSRTLRIISTIVLAFFLWTFGGLFDIAYAIKIDQQSAVSSKRTAVSSQQGQPGITPPNLPLPQGEGKKKPEEKFGKDMEDLENILKDDKADHETKKQKIKTKKADIDADDVEIRNQFKETEEKIKHLPGEIWKRHQDFVKKYEDNLKELRTNLDDIDKAKTDEEKEFAHKKAKDFVEKVKPPKKHQKLDPNKLPHRTEEPVWKEPRTKPEEFEQEDKNTKMARSSSKPLMIASNGPLTGLISKKTAAAISPDLPSGSYQIALANPPTDADLAETIEVQFTPEIRAKAAVLGNNPVKIYNWVRNNIEYVPTYGSIQGANYCLQTKLCNDFDTASLLIALLRVSGIHAKYVYGTIELPIEKVKNWVGGFTDSMEALRLLASAGVPTKGLVEGGVIKYVRLEHVHVEAWIDYIPSRGEKHKVGDTWIPLDASFKQYAYTQGMDIKTAVPFDIQTFINQIQSTATINEQAGYVTNINSLYIQQSMQDYQARVQNYITQNYPNAAVGDVLGKKEIVQQNHSYLLGTLPYKRIVTGAKYSSLPDSLRHKLMLEIYKDAYDALLGTKISVAKSFPELAGKRMSLNYVPATDADRNLINSYVQNYATSIPAYLVNLKAELKVDNAVIATGPSITMGTDQVLDLTFVSPTKSEVETHLMIAGDYNVIGLNIGGSKELLEKRIALGDYTDPVSEMLYQTILGYWTEYDTIKNIKAKSYKLISTRLPSEGLSSAPISIKYMFGSPFSGYYASRGLDIKRDLEVVSSIDGDKNNATEYNHAAGIVGSLLESSILDQLGVPPIR